MHVLIVSTTLDLATDAVVRELSARGAQITRWNTEAFPFEDRLTITLGDQLENVCELDRAQVREFQSQSVDLRTVDAVWYRRVRSPERPSNMDVGVYEFCVSEGRAATLGVLLGELSSTGRWMSRPTAVWGAEHKVYQLTVARSAGLSIPETVVTNDPLKIREAFARFDRQMIAKPVRSGYVELESGPAAIYTSQMLDEHVDDLEGAELSPVIYQRHIAKKCDVRVTVVGEKVFVAEIDSQVDPQARVDWRRTADPNLPHRVANLPSALTVQVIEFMKRLRLNFGAIDFIKTPDDQYIFLEVNPNGQWLWLDDRLDLGISPAIADWLNCD